MSDRRTVTPPPPPQGPGRAGRGMPGAKPKDLRGTLQRLWALTRGHRDGLGWMLLLSALASGVSILSPYLTGNAVSAISGGDAVTSAIMTLAGVYVADWLIRFLQQFFMASIGQNIIHHIRQALFSRIRALPLSFFDRHQHGELMSRLTNDVDNISTTISNSLSMLLTYFFTIVGILAAMLLLSPVLTLVALVGVMLIFILTRTVTRHTRRLFRAQQQALGTLNGQIEESISGMNVVKSFCRETEMEREFEDKSDALCREAVRALTWSGYLMPLMNVINNLCYVAIAVISSFLYLKGYFSSIGLITSFLLYVRQFTRPFVEIAGIYNSFQTAVAGAERVFELMDEETEPEDREDALPLESPRGDIEFRHVNFGYTSERQVLRDVSFTVPAGTKVAIVGPTGGGKTTVINLLTRFYDVSGGSILLDGHDIRDYRMADLRDAFGVVLQDTALFEASVLENIRYGHREAALDEVRRAAQIAGADAFIERLPAGYDTVLEQGGAELSQGERQLITIARAVLAGAPILILDEATSSVDTMTEQKIRRALLTLSRDRTSLIIAHRLSTVRDSDLILLIEDGQIREKGTHDELMALNGHYALMFRTQMGMTDKFVS
ncbi:MAG: ABC transporter ATP-binding protein [Clostridia bacterium]|nr:ABC transporter ATP-binding protein [Clostridia bacterium]